MHLLKIQTKNRSLQKAPFGQTGAAAAAYTVTAFGNLSKDEVDHLISSKKLLENLVTRRCDTWKIDALVQRKQLALKELYENLTIDSTELNRLLDRKTELYKDCGKDEDEDDFDAENHTEDALRNNEYEISKETEKRNERIGRLQSDAFISIFYCTSTFMDLFEYLQSLSLTHNSSDFLLMNISFDFYVHYH